MRIIKMRTLQVNPRLSPSDLKTKIRGIKGYNDVIDFIIIRATLTNPGIKAAEISKMYIPLKGYQLFR